MADLATFVHLAMFEVMVSECDDVRSPKLVGVSKGLV